MAGCDPSSASSLLAHFARAPCRLFSCVSAYVAREKNQRFDMTMSLVTCSKVFRPCLSLFRPVAHSPRLNGRRLFSSLQKRSIFVADRLLSRHQSNGNSTRENRFPISDGGLVILGFSLLGSVLLFVSMRYVLCLLPFITFAYVCKY